MADLETTITGLPDGQFNNSVRVVALNIPEKWSQGDIAEELRWHRDLQRSEVPPFLQRFVGGHDKSDLAQLLLPLRLVQFR